MINLVEGGYRIRIIPVGQSLPAVAGQARTALLTVLEQPSYYIIILHLLITSDAGDSVPPGTFNKPKGQ
jgi:hypothetical protein